MTCIFIYLINYLFILISESDRENVIKLWYFSYTMLTTMLGVVDWRTCLATVFKRDCADEYNIAERLCAKTDD